MKKVFSDSELKEDAVARNPRIAAADGKSVTPSAAIEYRNSEKTM